jgi:hypothetical protein
MGKMKTLEAKKNEYPTVFSDAQAGNLLRMLGYARPSRKQGEPAYKKFLETYLEPAMGPHDGNYNYIKIIPTTGDVLTQDTMPRIAYMAHHDTVHSQCGMQSANLMYVKEPIVKDGEAQRVVVYAENKVTFTKTMVKGRRWDAVAKTMVDFEEEKEIPSVTGFNSNCLGADCTVGVWLILEMIAANVPGVYVVHNDEEIGRQGAEKIVAAYKKIKSDITTLLNFPIVKYRPAELKPWAELPFSERMEIAPNSFWIDHVDIAMSFDRKAYHSIITHQRGSRTASDAFSASLSTLLSPTLVSGGYPEYEADPTGSFTDSASYDKLISECTNISVGYDDQHTKSETQDFTFAMLLRDALIANGQNMNDKTKLIAERDPTEVPVTTGSTYYGAGAYKGYNGYQGNQGNTYAMNNRRNWEDDDNDLYEWMQNGYSNTSGTTMGPKPNHKSNQQQQQKPQQSKKKETGNSGDDPFSPHSHRSVIADKSDSAGDVGGEVRRKDAYYSSLDNPIDRLPDSFDNEDELVDEDETTSQVYLTSMEEELYDEIAFDDTNLDLFIKYATTLGATHKGFVNFAASYGFDEDIAKLSYFLNQGA